MSSIELRMYPPDPPEYYLNYLRAEREARLRHRGHDQEVHVKPRRRWLRALRETKGARMTRWDRNRWSRDVKYELPAARLRRKRNLAKQKRLPFGLSSTEAS